MATEPIDLGTSADRDAEFRDFMLGRWPTLVRFAFALTGDRGEAEDLAQAALVKVYTNWRRVRTADDPDAYVRRILINTDHRRHRKRRVAESPTDRLPETSVADAGPAVEERTALVAALRELPPKQRAIVVLRYWDGLTETEVAALLGCSVGNVKSQSSRALAKLRASAHLKEGGRSW